ncbi:MAG: hypothetical protein SGI72_18530 [Planctomycetota bacterium]|nr:hypothetical protein [Planctomycetota bacterium]
MSNASNVDSAIQALVVSFSKQLELLVRRTTLEIVVERLELELGEPSQRGRLRNEARVGSPRVEAVRVRHSVDHLIEFSEKLLTHVKENPGQRSEQVAVALNTDVHTMRLPMRKLIAAQKIRTEGRRRGMTYTAT